MKKRSLPADPRPLPPQQPALEDCCRGGCDPCVFELYEDAMDRYRAALAAWEVRQTVAQARPARGRRD